MKRKSSVYAPMEIGNEDCLIVAVGSMGVSTVKRWMDEGIRIKSPIVVAHRSNAKAIIGYEDVEQISKQWMFDLESISIHEGVSMNESISKFGLEISQKLKNNHGIKKIIVLAGLGKMTGSYIVPIVIGEAKKLGITTCVICTKPFSFESRNHHHIADETLEIIDSMAEEVIVHENSEICVKNMSIARSMKKIFVMLSYAIGCAVNACCNGLESKGLKYMIISDERYIGKEVFSLNEYLGEKVFVNIVGSKQRFVEGIDMEDKSTEKNKDTIIQKRVPLWRRIINRIQGK